MRRFLPYVAVLLVFSTTPAAGEITEHVVHLLTTGHTAHAIDDDAHAPDNPEHGCSGPFHFCACHSSIAFTASLGDADVGSGLAKETAVGGWHENALPDGFLDSVFRPPIA